MFLGVLQPDLVWWTLTESQQGLPQPPNIVHKKPVLYTVQYCVAGWSHSLAVPACSTDSVEVTNIKQTQTDHSCYKVILQFL